MSSSFLKDISLSKYSTFKVGGNAEYFLEAKEEQEVISGASKARALGFPLFILGGGSNVLFSDSGFKGCVIKISTKGIKEEMVGDKTNFVVAAGEELDSFILHTINRGYWGLENLSSIPGGVGATPVQNVGAYGVEIGNFITKVKALNSSTGEIKDFSQAQCQFGYRDSFFKTDEGKKWIILEVTFSLSKEPNPIVDYPDLIKYGLSTKTNDNLIIRNAIAEIRGQKFPDWKNGSLGTAGSFFKNPIISKDHFEELQKIYLGVPGFENNEGEVKVPLGWVLDKVCNLKGYKRDGVACYEKQALVIVADDGTTAAAIDEFANFIAEEVYKKTKIKIEREVTKIF